MTTALDTLLDRSRAYDRIMEYLADRKALLDGMLPLDNRAEQTKFCRTDELQQLLDYIRDLKP